MGLDHSKSQPMALSLKRA